MIPRNDKATVTDYLTFPSQVPPNTSAAGDGETLARPD